MGKPTCGILSFSLLRSSALKRGESLSRFNGEFGTKLTSNLAWIVLWGRCGNPQPSSAISFLCGRTKANLSRHGNAHLNINCCGFFHKLIKEKKVLSKYVLWDTQKSCSFCTVHPFCFCFYWTPCVNQISALVFVFEWDSHVQCRPS